MNTIGTAAPLRAVRLYVVRSLLGVLLTFAFAGASAQTRPATTPRDPDVVANRLIVIYAGHSLPDNLAAHISAAQGQVVATIPRWGMAVVQSDSGNVAADSAHISALQAKLAADPAVAYVIHDRRMHASRLLHTHAVLAGPGKQPSTGDFYYTSTPQAWAVKQVGGYGAGVAGGPAQGPWNVSMGRGVKIAVLDSGVSSTHPDTAPNLISAVSLVDQTALPSPCDDGSPEDQDGHGTWTASLAAAALGPKTGMVVGVAPQASLLNIKVLERVPAVGSGSTTSLCEQGSADGLMSWLIAGIALAAEDQADIISVSAGGLLDSDSGEAEGTIAAFNIAAYNATQEGSLIIAAAGNDGESLDNSRYIEMPAQAEDVLAVVATTNPQCAQNENAGAACETGAVALAYYSNYGTTIRAVAAPGGSYPAGSYNGSGVSGFVRGACSTGLPGTRDGLPSQKGESFGCFGFGHTQYVVAIGTSASAPLVAGVAALLKGANPSLSPAQIAALVRSTAQPMPAPSGVALNVVSAEAALQ
jgi:subtilisin family serine protease